MPLNRLDRLLSDLGIASRRELKEIIKAGRVSVDGIVLTTPETKVNSDTSEIVFDGKPLIYKKYRVYMMDKPSGVVTATEDRKEKTVLDLLSPELRRMGLFPVGRLDKDTSGLLLLTNDGELAHKIISPKSGIEKKYYARVDGIPNVEDVRAFREGLVLADGLKCLPAKLELTGGSECYVTVMEGKYHQVKRMLASRGKKVLELRRISVGGLELDEKMNPGSWRELDENDLCRVFSANILDK